MKLYTKENCQDLKAILAANPNYTSIYLNVTKSGNLTQLKFTKHAGQILHAVSEYDDDCIYKILGDGKEENNEDKQMNTNIKEVKKTKTGSLFNFLGKKSENIN